MDSIDGSTAPPAVDVFLPEAPPERKQKHQQQSAAVRSSWEWLNKKDAAELLGVNLRQLERRVAAGQVQKQVVERKPWQRASPVVFSRKDIEAILRGEPNQYARVVKQTAAAPEPAAEQVEETAVAVNGAPAHPPAAAPGLPWRELAVHLAAIASQKVTEKPWLSLTEAAQYSGLPLRWLRDRAKAGAIPAVNVGVKRERWMFNREGLTKVP
jgi:hypothetical protein